MAYPILLTLATGRSGTTYLYKLASNLYRDTAMVEHEALTHRQARLRRLFRCYQTDRIQHALEYREINEFLERVAKESTRRPVLLFGNSLSHLAPVFIHLFQEQLKLLLLHRNPVCVAASVFVMSKPSWWLNIPDYNDDPYGNKLTPLDPNVAFKAATSRWNSMTRFDRILYHTIEQINYAFECTNFYTNNARLVVKSENLFEDSTLIPRIFGLAELTTDTVSFEQTPKNSIWPRLREQQPLGNAWKTYSNHPELFQLNEDYLHHDLDYNSLLGTMEKYQLPKGIKPWLRHYVKYWEIREYTARSLRKAGLLRPPRVNQGVNPDE